MAHDKDSTIPKFLESLRSGQPEYNAAQAAGISLDTVWHWKREVPGFSEQIAEAKLTSVSMVEDALYKTALKGSVQAQLAWLEKHDKGWRDRLKDSVPQNTIVLAMGPAALLERLNPEKRARLLAHVRQLKSIASEGTNGNGSHSNGTSPEA